MYEARTPSAPAITSGQTSRGMISLGIALIAIVGSLVASAWLAMLVQSAVGADFRQLPLLQDPAQPNGSLMRTLAFSQLLWTLAGVLALIQGVVAMVKDRGKALGLVGVAISVVAPVV